MSSSKERFPARVYRLGEEPDVRFSLANERTFLAWIRTALAMIAAGVALEALGLSLHPGLRLAASAALIVGGMIAAVQAWRGWAATETSLRLSKALPSSFAPVAMVVVVLLVSVLVLLAVLLA
jgi:putative membrane protein